MIHIDYKGYSCWSDLGMLTPCQYIKMIDLLEEFKPDNICELGSGQSTEIFETYCNKTNAKLHSIEYDIYYMTHKNNVKMQLIENTSININNCLYNNCTIYKELEDWLLKQNKFDFILIDGPNDTLPNNDKNIQYSRIQLLSFINNLSNKSIILYHDSNAINADKTLNEFERQLSLNSFKYDKEIIKETNKEIIEYNNKYLGLCPELIIYYLSK